MICSNCDPNSLVCDNCLEFDVTEFKCRITGECVAPLSDACINFVCYKNESEDDECEEIGSF